MITSPFLAFQMMPANVPPVSPLDRYRGFQTGTAVGKLIRKLNLEKQVFVVSKDPFKLVAANHQNPTLILGWWVGTSLYAAANADRSRKEFVDLPGLRNCYKTTVSIQGPKFIEFTIESGIVTKSVNGSIVDLDFDIYDNPSYFSGRKDKTVALVAQNYNPKITFGTLMVFNQGQSPRNEKADDSKLLNLKTSGVNRIITDDIDHISVLLHRPTSDVVIIRFNMSLLVVCVIFGMRLIY